MAKNSVTLCDKSYTDQYFLSVHMCLHTEPVYKCKSLGGFTNVQVP